MLKADIILHVVDQNEPVSTFLEWLEPFAHKTIEVLNKWEIRLKKLEELGMPATKPEGNCINAKTGEGIEKLKEDLYQKALEGRSSHSESIVTNVRHVEALLKVRESLNKVIEGMQHHLSSDLLAPDIRNALYFLGSITGQVEVDRDILGTIFGKFCIGK